MPLPEDGPLTLAMIRDEYGGTNPASLSQYYAGGPFVPAGTEGINGPIPSAGQIDFDIFYGSPSAEIVDFILTVGTGESGGSTLVGLRLPPMGVPLFGSTVPPSPPVNGVVCFLLEENRSFGSLQKRVGLNGGPLPQDHWFSINFGGELLLTADAPSFSPGPPSIWVFNNYDETDWIVGQDSPIQFII